MKGSNPECPCGSGLRYSACCRPYHRGEPAPDARTLMRSRYSAYALGEAEYLWNTLHPDHPSRQEGHDAFVAHLRASRQTLRFARLRIFDDDVSADGQTARVLFHAELYEKGKERSFVELSTFMRTAEGWRYLSGETRDVRAGSKELDTLKIR